MARPLQWRERRSDEGLGPLETSVATIPGRSRCGALGLKRGDCQQQRKPGSAYCAYHDKLQREMCDPMVQDSYPAWPLPKHGYVFVDPKTNRRVAAA